MGLKKLKIDINEVINKVPAAAKTDRHKDAVLLLLKQASLMARAAPPWGGRFTLLPVFTL
ncbi:Uncharacterised protein [Yersinia enterocolitica]|nr:Uncharacterised protein [Yersinia enterocolitica]